MPATARSTPLTARSTSNAVSTPKTTAPWTPAAAATPAAPLPGAYLRHLFASQELLAFRLNSLHNLTYFLDLVRGAREAILQNRYGDYLARIAALYPDEAARAAGA